MSQKFQSEVRQGEGVTFVRFVGVIDEDNELGEVAEKVGSGSVVINLADIERINSCGVRDWVNWLGRIEKNGAKPVLVECSPAIVAQINLVNNFTGTGAVKSFFAPYFCPQCDREKVLLVDTADVAGKQPVKAPTCRCDECDGVMDFDDMEESYFAFIANAKKIAPDFKLEAALAKLAPAEGDKSKVRAKGSNPGSHVSTPTGPSLPSVPSVSRAPATMPGPARTMTNPTPGKMAPIATNPGSRPGSFPGSAVGRAPGITGTHRIGTSTPGASAQPAPAGGSKMIYVVVALIIVAIALLAVVIVHQHGLTIGSAGVGRPPATRALGLLS